MKVLVTFFVLLPLLLTAQSPVRVRGRVLDAVSGEGLAFATIAYGKGGTYANADGYFAFTPGGANADSVSVSFIGYQTLRTTVAGLRASPTVRLQPAGSELSEIVVLGRDERLYALLERCRENLRTWPTSVAKGYFQLATTLGGTPVEFMQNYYNVTFSGQGITALELKAGRVAVQDADSLAYRSLGTSQGIARLTLAERAADFADHPLQLTRKVLSRKYYLSEIPEFSDARTVHLRFDPVRQDRQLFSGELWVDAGTAELKKLILRHPALKKYPFSPISSRDRIGAFDVEFIYTFADRQLRHLQWYFAYDHHLHVVGKPPEVNRIAADCSLICFDADTPFFSPRTEYSEQYGDYRKLAFFPYDTLFWRHAPQVPLTDRQRRQMAALGMNENRIDYGGQSDTLARTPNTDLQRMGLDRRNMFWSPHWRFVHNKVTPRGETRKLPFGHSGFAPAVQLFLDAFPLGDSLAFNSATFLDIYATRLTVAPSKEYNAALNMYFDLCELNRREMLTELRAGPVDIDFVARTYDKHRAAIAQLRKEFFREVRRGRDQERMEHYNYLILDALGVNNLEIFKVYAYAWQ